MIDKIFGNIFGSEESEQSSEEGIGNSEQEQEEEKEEGQENMLTQSGLPDPGRQHQDMIAPSVFIEEEDMARVGDDYAQTLFILGWPDEPDMMFMQDILFEFPVKSQISIHVNPRQKDQAVNELERQLEKARAQAGRGVTAASEQSRQRRYQQTQRVYDALSQTDANLHEVGMYVTIRADNEDDLRLAVEELVREMRTMSISPEVLKHNQKKGLQATSPTANDPIKYRQPMLSGAVGAMYPFGTTTIMEHGGIDAGIHAGNRSPVVINRFDRENGYNQLTAGKIGSGKTFGTLLEILRTKAAYGDDLVVFMLDPLNGFQPVSNLLNGKEILVGGNVNINPMRITKTPDDVLEEVPDLDPYGNNKKNLIDFFSMFFEKQNRELGESRDILEMAIDDTYEQAGITPDVETHDNKSPTILDMIEILEDMTENPADFAQSDSESLVDDIEDHAARLLRAFNQFQGGGQFSNLSKESELDIQDEDVVYFNLSQQEGSGDIGLMMHMLLSEVYERAKDTDSKVMLCIDEAHYIMADAKSLDFLEQATRHSRHYDLSINFITQTIEEFFAHEQSATIAKQCSMKRLHRIESGLNEEIMDALNLNRAHVSFIQNAQPGDEDAGYSEALIGVDEYGYVPTRIYPSDFELDAIDGAE